METLTQKEIAYRRIRDGILNRKWMPGTRIVERDLSREFNVSRTPIREAIAQLEKEGLVTQVPKWGAYIKKIDQTEIMETYEVREALESEAARLAAARATKRDIRTLKSIINKMDAHSKGNLKDASLLNRLDAEFHEYLVKACHNRKLISLYAQCHIDISSIPGKIKKVETERKTRKREVEYHRLILRSLEKRQESVAASAAGRHVKRARQRAEDYFKKVTDDTGTPA